MFMHRVHTKLYKKKHERMLVIGKVDHEWFGQFLSPFWSCNSPDVSALIQFQGLQIFGLEPS